MLFAPKRILRIGLRTRVCIFFAQQVKGSGPVKFNSTSWFGSTTDGGFPRSPSFEREFSFLFA